MAGDRLFGKWPGGLDPGYDLVLDECLARNEYPAQRLEAARAAEHTCLAARFCTREIWEKYKDKMSTGPAGWTLARCINSGVLYPSSFVGCHAGDVESYDDFREFFYPLIAAYHQGIPSEVAAGMASASERLDPSKIVLELSAAAQSKVVSTRIRVARNLEGFPLNPGGSRESRDAIAKLMGQVYAELQDEDFRGKFYLHTTMSDEEREALIEGRHLFRGRDEMQAASGYHMHWPHGRGVFLNPAKTFVNWVNEGDHLRIISMERGSDVKAVFSRLSAGVAAIEAGVRKVTGRAEGNDIFATHPRFGSVTCCPSNLGTGMRGSVHILVPKLIVKIGFEAIDGLARERNCQARGSSGEHSAVVDRIDISNWRRLGVPEYELVGDMIACANFLAAQEDAIPTEPAAATARALPGEAAARAPRPLEEAEGRSRL